MDSPRKNNDCYFYYYSTCLKGDGCMFRHEPAALGCETVCTFWQQGKCLNQRCNFRHMELRKNRKIIPCYWENQPGGCRKPHCSFQHKNPREAAGNDHEKNKECENVGAAKPQERPEWPRRTVLAEGAQFDECVGSSDDSGRVGPRRVSQGSEASYGSPPVDPLVVNFEEESDNESVPTSTPTKKPQKNVHVKTLEEIRLDRIQAESAAFYSYKEGADPAPDVADLRSRIVARKNLPKSSPNFRVLTLDEIRKNRAAEKGADSETSEEFVEPAAKKMRKDDVSVDSVVKSDNVESVKEHVNNNVDKSLLSENVEVDIRSKKTEGNSDRKRSHSPIIFDERSKKAVDGFNEEESIDSSIKNNHDSSVKNKENKVGDVKNNSPTKKFRKLRRQPNNITKENEQPTRVVRLRRMNLRETRSQGRIKEGSSSEMKDVSEALEKNEVSSEVPANTELVSAAENNISGNSSRETNSSIDTSMPTEVSTTDTDEASHLENNTLGRTEQQGPCEGQVLNERINCDVSKDQWSLHHSADDDDLFLSSNDCSVTLKAEDDILQDIDDILGE